MFYVSNLYVTQTHGGMTNCAAKIKYAKQILINLPVSQVMIICSFTVQSNGGLSTGEKERENVRDHRH
jgi:hypothetical protein